jgi:hypothetical protein
MPDAAIFVWVFAAIEAVRSRGRILRWTHPMQTFTLAGKV